MTAPTHIFVHTRTRPDADAGCLIQFERRASLLPPPGPTQTQTAGLPVYQFSVSCWQLTANGLAPHQQFTRFVLARMPGPSVHRLPFKAQVCSHKLLSSHSSSGLKLQFRKTSQSHPRDKDSRSPSFASHSLNDAVADPSDWLYNAFCMLITPT